MPTCARTTPERFWQLLNPFALLAGVISVAMLAMHGAAYLAPARRRRSRPAPAQRCLVVTAARSSGVVVIENVDVATDQRSWDFNGQLQPPLKAAEKAPARGSTIRAWLDDAACRLLRRRPGGTFGTYDTCSYRQP